MASKLVTIRDLIKSTVDARKVLMAPNNFIINDFTTETAWVPFKKVEDLPTAGHLTLVGMATDLSPKENRSNLCQWILSVQLAYQVVCNATDVAQIDKYVELMEQIRETCRKQVATAKNVEFSWMRDEVYKDENGTPYMFVTLRDNSVFECYVTIFYGTVLA